VREQLRLTQARGRPGRQRIGVWIISVAHLDEWPGWQTSAMTARLIRSKRLFPDAPYAYAATTADISMVFTAGACPLDEHGVVTAPGDVAAQTRQALANLRIELEESRATFRDVVKTTVYVVSNDRADLATAWHEVAAAFGDHDAPSTLLGVTVLGYADQLVEIEAIAAR
jgi:enamine deaminase RidA (YjgF/YER057c/UK114 family)